MDVFAEVKEQITMAQVLQQFNLQPDRRGNILCPFHADHKPSCKIYEKSFYCWACGAGGDVINFTARYLNVSNLEAAKYLAAAFGILTDEPETLRQQAAREKQEQKRRVEQQWQEWQDWAYRVLTCYQAWLFWGLRSGDTENHWWVKYHQKESIVAYYLDCLTENPEEFYQIYRKEVEQIAAAINRQHQGGERTAG